MGLCVGFVQKTVLMTQGCFCHCWAALIPSRGLFCPSHGPASEWAGAAQEAGRGHGQDSQPRLTEGIVHNVWCYAQHLKLGEKEGRGSRGCHSELWSLVFPSNHYAWWSPAFLEMAACWWEI